MRDYLTRQRHSKFWAVRLQTPAGSTIQSIRTLAVEQGATPEQAAIIATDRNQSLIVANNAIMAHKRKLLAAQGCTVIGADGAETQRILPRVTGAALATAINRPSLAVKNADDALIEDYIKHGLYNRGYVPGKQPERETRTMWALFQTITEGKALKDCTRDDGRKLLAKLQENPDAKSATIKKKIGRLCAAVNRAIKEGKLSFNPFSGVAVLKDDATKRLPLEDNEMRLCLDNLDKLSDHDAKLFRLLAATGMRPGEAFEIGATITRKVKNRKTGEINTVTEINSDKIEEGVRYVVVGTKTRQSKRRVPLPASWLALYPAPITGPLFRDPARALPRLNAWMIDLGIVEEGKVLYSLRHRAKDRLRAVKCPPHVAEELFGRGKVTVGDGYGKGEAVTELKHWVDLICPPEKLKLAASA